MRYQYVAATADGVIKRGIKDAASVDELARQLRADDLYVVSVQPQERGRNATQAADRIGFGRVSILDKVIFVRHLSIMLRSGLSLVEALRAILEQTDAKKMKAITRAIIEQVANGRSLAESMGKFPKVFGGLIRGMVTVGEASGTLEQNLDYVAAVLEKDYELRRKVRSAMIYPVIVLTATVALGIGLSIFILPRLVRMFETFRLELPPITQAFLSVATFLVDYGIFVMAGLVLLLVGLRVLARLPATRPYFHELYLRLPIIKRLVITVNTARAARVMGILLESGVTINESLAITADVTGNAHFQERLRQGLAIVSQGKSLAASLQQDKYFPRMASRMLAEGEKTGNLQQSFSYIAEYYEKELDSATKNLATVLEPILLIVIGVVLGFLAVAIISPIYQFTGSLQR